jgi:PAS domain S-box-containing protein
LAEDNTYSHLVERRRAETELEHSLLREREARRELSGILESINDAFFAVDQGWRFTYVNSKAEQFWSRTRADLLGKNMWEEFPHAADSEAFREIRRAMEEGVTTTFEAISPDLRAWVYGSAYPSPEGVSVYLQDITERKEAEEALKESEERYRTLFESIDEGFCVIEVMFDADGEPVDYRFLETNPAFERHTGLHGATGKRMRELAPDHEAYWFEIYGHVASTGEPVRFVREAKALGGRWFDVYAFRLGGPESRRLALVFNDITEQKRSEEALRESEELHRLIVEGARDYAIFTTDLEGRIASWPPGAATIFGWTADEIIGQPAAMTFVPEDQASGEPEKELATARDKGVAPDVRWHLRKDGSRVFIEGITRYLRGARGLPRGFLKIGQDVTERREAEAALRESELRFRSLVSNVPGAIFHGAIREGHPTMEYVSDRIEEITGYPASDFTADRVRTYVSVVHPEDLPKNEEAVARAIERGEPYVLEYRILHADGGTRWVIERGSGVLSRAGEPLWIDGAIFDSTEHRRLAEERERLLSHEWTSRAQSEERRRISRELHDRVAHDMALVHQSLELHAALRESDPERAESKMELARETLKKALHSTRNLSMQLRHPEAGRRLEPALADLLRDLVPPAVSSRLTVEGDESPVPPELRAQLFAILREAVRNAVTHSGCEEIVVGLEISEQELVGRVEDDGRGFDAAQTRRGGGIRSMEERAALLNGTLEVSSAPGRGTRLTVSVPLEEGP